MCHENEARQAETRKRNVNVGLPNFFSYCKPKVTETVLFRSQNAPILSGLQIILKAIQAEADKKITMTLTLSPSKK